MWHRFAYSLFMVLALGVFLLVRRVQPWQSTKLPKRQRTALGLAAFIGGMLGAKAGFMIANLGSWSFDFVWLADGKTVLTGITCAYLAVELTKLARGITAKTGDDFALPLALALAVGRWGCFCNGCCFGTPTTLPWAVVFHDGLPRHPTQIYESLFHLTMAGALFSLACKNRLPTHRLQFYLIAYCVFRFLTEYIRPEPPWLFGLTFYQWNAVALGMGLVGQWGWDERGRKKPGMLFPTWDRNNELDASATMPL